MPKQLQGHFLPNNSCINNINFVGITAFLKVSILTYNLVLIQGVQIFYCRENLKVTIIQY